MSFGILTSPKTSSSSFNERDEIYEELQIKIQQLQNKLKDNEQIISQKEGKIQKLKNQNLKVKSDNQELQDKIVTIGESKDSSNKQLQTICQALDIQYSPENFSLDDVLNTISTKFQKQKIEQNQFSQKDNFLTTLYQVLNIDPRTTYSDVILKIKALQNSVKVQSERIQDVQNENLNETNEKITKLESENNKFRKILSSLASILSVSIDDSMIKKIESLLKCQNENNNLKKELVRLLFTTHGKDTKIQIQNDDILHCISNLLDEESHLIAIRKTLKASPEDNIIHQVRELSEIKDKAFQAYGAQTFEEYNKNFQIQKQQFQEKNDKNSVEKYKGQNEKILKSEYQSKNNEPLALNSKAKLLSLLNLSNDITDPDQAIYDATFKLTQNEKKYHDIAEHIEEHNNHVLSDICSLLKISGSDISSEYLHQAILKLLAEKTKYDEQIEKLNKICKKYKINNNEKQLLEAIDSYCQSITSQLSENHQEILTIKEILHIDEYNKKNPEISTSQFLKVLMSDLNAKIVNDDNQIQELQTELKKIDNLIPANFKSDSVYEEIKSLTESYNQFMTQLNARFGNTQSQFTPDEILISSQNCIDNLFTVGQILKCKNFQDIIPTIHQLINIQKEMKNQEGLNSQLKDQIKKCEEQVIFQTQKISELQKQSKIEQQKQAILIDQIQNYDQWAGYFCKELEADSTEEAAQNLTLLKERMKMLINFTDINMLKNVLQDYNDHQDQQIHTLKEQIEQQNQSFFNHLSYVQEHFNEITKEKSQTINTLLEIEKDNHRIIEMLDPKPFSSIHIGIEGTMNPLGLTELHPGLFSKTQTPKKTHNCLSSEI